MSKCLYARVRLGRLSNHRYKMFDRRLLFAFVALQTCLVLVAALRNQTVILISLDGFRWDYMSKTNTPNFDFIARTGIKAPYVKNVFPTVTMPNLYTIVTGLYPESHGIIANEMFDPDFGAMFSSGNNETRWWDGGEPVWVTNQKQGFKSGTSFWPGYDVAIRGYFPSFSTTGAKYSKPFASKGNLMPAKERIDAVIKWLTTADEPPTFVAMSFLETDTLGHKYGPDSPEIEAAIREYDTNVTGYLLEQLRQVNLLDQVNIIVTSDHGMIAYNTSNVVNFDDIINASTYDGWSGNKAFFTIEPHLGKANYVYDSLKEAQRNTQLFEVYKKEDVPDDLHFKHNRRIASIVGLMKEGWYARSSKLPDGNLSYGVIRGDHGYSNSIKAMYPFFIARGPAFKENFSSEPFELTDIYPLMCKILGIVPAPNNGTLSRVNGLFRESLAPPTEFTNTSEASTESTTENPQREGNNIVKIAGFSILGFTAFVCIVATIMLTVQWCKRRNRPRMSSWLAANDEMAVEDEVVAANDADKMPVNDETAANDDHDDEMDEHDETEALQVGEVRV